ncbi:hypothetical protein [Shewanella pneumatophori]|uniref:Uncharacterized protein n=1 Tax=Shewanella pneumatophori TaxID=314092 RepID=A0A9X1ZDR3_9GAMM|nr:hypothetical protein [Shewanella pneumatophori]MCL1137947.1 hypothetical protein [Shewanella pneumatophori]
MEPSWMMVQAWGDMDVPSEPLGDFYWSMRPVSNACNFVGAAGAVKEGIAVDPLFPLCELEAHDFYQAQLDMRHSHDVNC